MSNYEERILQLFEQRVCDYNVDNCACSILNNKKIIFFGAGSGGVAFLNRILRKYRIKASAVIDRKFKSGDKYFGIPAFSSRDYKPTEEEKITLLL
jgi:hypothetical protein